MLPRTGLTNSILLLSPGEFERAFSMGVVYFFALKMAGNAAQRIEKGV
jgi:hypothetical protein